jgi:hypothetical protein
LEVRGTHALGVTIERPVMCEAFAFGIACGQSEGSGDVCVY